MKELRIDAKVDNLDNVLAFLDDILEEAECPLKEQMQLDIAVEEIFVNIANYAYVPKKGDALIRVENLDAPKGVSITFIDSGIPYDPLKKEDPDITLGVEERQIGGLGIFMVKKSMDEVFYEHKEGKNHFTMKKYFE